MAAFNITIEEIEILNIDAEAEFEVIYSHDGEDVEILGVNPIQAKVFDAAGDQVSPSAFGYNSEEIFHALQVWFDAHRYDDDFEYNEDALIALAYDDAATKDEAARDDYDNHKLLSWKESRTPRGWESIG